MAFAITEQTVKALGKAMKKDTAQAADKVLAKAARKSGTLGRDTFQRTDYAAIRSAEPKAPLAANAPLSFMPVEDLGEILRAPWAKSTHLITFEGSFDRKLFSNAYGSTKEGYQLWDRHGHALEVDNIFTETLFSNRSNARDLNEGSKWLLNQGTFAKIEGKFIPQHQYMGSYGPVPVPASIDVYFINGKPVRDFVSK